MAFVTPVVEHCLEREIAQWEFLNRQNQNGQNIFFSLSLFLKTIYKRLHI